MTAAVQFNFTFEGEQIFGEYRVGLFADERLVVREVVKVLDGDRPDDLRVSEHEDGSGEGEDAAEAVAVETPVQTVDDVRKRPRPGREGGHVTQEGDGPHVDDSTSAEVRASPPVPRSQQRQESRRHEDPGHRDRRLWRQVEFCSLHRSPLLLYLPTRRKLERFRQIKPRRRTNVFVFDLATLSQDASTSDTHTHSSRHFLPA